MSRPSQISLVSSYGPYVSVAGGTLIANQNSLGANETFTLSDCGNNQVALQTSTGTYVTAENGGGDVLHVNRPALGPWEKFTLIDLGYGRIALQASNGQYVCADQTRAFNLVANRSAIGSWETFGLIDRTIPDVQASPPGSPLITTCVLNNDAQLLQYNPATGDLYRTGVNVFGFIEAPVLLSRENPCDRGCSLIVAASVGGSAYLITYRRSDGKASLHPLTHDGLGAPRSIGPWDKDFAQAISVTFNGTQYLLFYRMNGGPITSYQFIPSTPTALSFNKNIDGGNLDADWAQLVPVSMSNAQCLLGYRRTTGEAILWDLSASGLSNYRVMGIFDRTWSQLTSFVDSAGQMIFLRAGSSEMYFYQIGTGGLSDPKPATLPAMRPPTLRLHAVQSGQLVQVEKDGGITLCADNNIDNSSKLELLPDDSGSFRLRSLSNTLLCVDASGHLTTCADSNRTAASLFQMVSQPGACFRLRSANGSYVWADPAQGLQLGSDDSIQQLGVFAQSIFEWNDYGIGGGISYLDDRLGQLATPPAFTSLVPVHSEYDSAANAFCFSTRSANEAAAAGLQSRDTVFHAYGSQMAGTLPVYLEKQVSGQGYHLSTRDAQTAAAWGYQQLGIAFYAYATQQPGTVPVYRECPSGALGSQYYFSTRSASDATAAGWQQMDIAFYAYAPLAPVHSEVNAAGSYYFSTRGISEAADAGFKSYDTVFCAYRSWVPGTIPVYIEQSVSGQGEYHLSTRDAQSAAQWGYKQLGIAFYAYATQQPGTVPVYRECPSGAPWSQYYFSTRSAGDAAGAGWQQMDVAFYAYLPGPYLVARTQLIDAWLSDSAQTVPGYRIVLDCCTIAGQPVQTAITLSATAVTTLQLSDGSMIEVGPVRPITRSTSADGQLSFIIETSGQLLTPVIKVKADFMGGSQVLAIAPDQNAHRALANLDPATLGQVVGNRAALVKQVMGVLANAAPLAVAPATDTSNVSSIMAFGLLDDIGHAIGNFFTHTIPSIAQDGAKAISQAVQPIVQLGQKTAQTVVTSLTAGANSVIAPGSPVMVALQGATTQVQAVIAQGLAAAGQVASQIQAGVNVAIAFTTAIIKEAGTIGERAFNAFLIDVGTANKLLIASAHEAESFVIELVKQAGKALSDLLALVTARFNWNAILTTHNGINSILNHVLDLAQPALGAQLAKGKTTVVDGIRNTKNRFDGSFHTWLDNLSAPLNLQPQPALDSAVEYFQALFQRQIGQASLSLPPSPGAEPGGFGDALTQSLSGINLPGGSTKLDPQNPLALIQGGPKLLFSALGSLIDAVLNGAADLAAAQFDALQALFDSGFTIARQLLNAPLSIPILSDLYEKVIVNDGQTKLTLLRLISLVAAMVLGGIWQAATGSSQSPLSADVVSTFTQISLTGLPSRPRSFSEGADDGLPSWYRPVLATAHAVRAVIALIQIKLYAFPNHNQVLECAVQWAWVLANGAKAFIEWVANPASQTTIFGLEIWVSMIILAAASTRPLFNPSALETYPKFRAGYNVCLFALNMALWGVQSSEPLDQLEVNLGGGANVMQGLIGVAALFDGDVVTPKVFASRLVAGVACVGLFTTLIFLTAHEADPDAI